MTARTLRIKMERELEFEYRMADRRPRKESKRYMLQNR